MACKSLLSSSLALTSFLSLSLVTLFLQPHQAFASSRGKLSLPYGGICSIAVTVHGYKCQEFEVTTDDGYILSVQRIPEGRVGGAGGSNRPPVLLQHGLFVDGMTWVLNSPEESLGMILADNGFDVWISNLRGTRFSRQHVSLDPADSEFWNWSWDDLITHDLPSVVNLVYNQTGQKMHYVGHSMGTLMALTSFSEARLVDKVKSAVLLSPIAYLSHMTSPFGVVAAKLFADEVINVLGVAEFNPKGQPVGNFLKTVCSISGLNCYDMMAAFTGENCCLNKSAISIVLKNEPQSTSTKNLVHFAQTVRSGVLSKYDYGNPIFNMKHYGQFKPPVYDLSKIPHDLPLFLTYGGRDALSDVTDVNELLDSLKMHDTEKLSVQFIKDYGHVDVIMGVNAKDLIYNQVVAFFRSHN